MKIFSFRNKTQWQNQRLDQVIFNYLSTIIKFETSKGEVRKVIESGSVFLNNKVCRICSKKVFTKAEVFIVLHSLDSKITIKEENIVFENQNLVAFNKPSGLSTQSTLNDNDDHLFNQARYYFTVKDKGLAYIGLHHRLDRDTSGVVIMTKKKSANRWISDAFKSHQIHKTYLAVCDVNPTHEPKQKWIVKSQLKRTPTAKHSFYFSSVDKGGQSSETRFTTLATNNDKALIQAQPITGRTHQIRVHLKESGFAIVGDRLYNPENSSGRLLLHAWKLVLPDICGQKKLQIEANIPKEFLDLFPNTL